VEELKKYKSRDESEPEVIA
jgi:hypothetical protein